MRKPVVAFAWYRASDWKKLREAAADADQLAKTHQAWLWTAEKARKQLQRKGVQSVRVFIDVDELIAWCKEQNTPLNAQARSRFAAKMGQERTGDDSSDT